MTTTSGLIAETRRHLESYRRSPMNQLAADITDSATDLTFAHAIGQIQTGTYLEIDLELMYVWSVDQTAKTAVVQRGQAGSTAAAHTSGTVVVSDPPYPDFAILKALNDELLDLSSPINGLYATRTVELTGTTASHGYNLTGATNVMDILAVSASYPGAARTWQPVTNYELTHNAETDDFASGYALRLNESVYSGRQVRVVYKASFSPLNTLTDDVETVAGLPASMHDIPPLGAAMRLVAPREIRRNQIESQGDTRRAEEVPAGAVLGSMRGIAALRQQRIVAEAARLAQQHPDRTFTPAGPSVW